MIPLPVLILVGVVLSILIGFGSYQFYFKDWKSCDWGYGCPTPSTPSAPTPSTPAPVPCDVNQRVKGGECVACGEEYLNPAGDDPAEYKDTFCKQCAENYHVKGRKCVKCEDKYTHPAGDLVAKGNTKCSKCGLNHRATGGGNCVTCDIGAGSEGAYNDAGDDRFSKTATSCVDYLSRGVPKKIRKCHKISGSAGCAPKMEWQTEDEFKGTYPGGWDNDLKCAYSETNHGSDEAWKKSCPGGDPAAGEYSYAIPSEWTSMKDAE